MSQLTTRIFTFLIIFSILINGNVLESENLLMIQALFRHGERTTDSFYPNDPYVNYSFYPISKGGLTNKGKLQEYNLGKYLRKKYDKFLGDLYSDDIMKIRSTEFMRTRISALLVAAGLWPPAESQIWNDDLHWLPIPVDYKPYEEDDLLNPGACAKRIHILKHQFKDEEVKKLFINPHKHIMEYLQFHSGKIMKSPADVSELYLILKTEEDTNFKLPNWTKAIYPEPIYSVASTVYSYFNYNLEIKKINAGYFLKKVLDDFDHKITNNNDPAKIFLYSGHESTLGHILNALKVVPHVANYGSAIIFELHKNIANNQHYVKILYKSGTDDTTIIKEIIYPGCEKVCSPSEFREKISDILPNISYQKACELK